jgi:hypothetical protein
VEAAPIVTEMLETLAASADDASESTEDENDKELSVAGDSTEKSGQNQE